MRECSVSGCDNKYKATGLCDTHRKWLKKFGTTAPVCWCGELSQIGAGNRGSTTLCKRHFFLERFWEYVDVRGEDDCWEWQGSKTKAGYGVLYWSGLNLYTHRISLELEGFDIPDKYHACHHCDNPPCVNPKHLYVGTPKNNVDDKVRRNRHTHGENHPGAKLSNEDIAKIRELAKEGVWQSDIARQFNVDSSHISNIINNLVRRTS